MRNEMKVINVVMIMVVCLLLSVNVVAVSAEEPAWQTAKAKPVKLGKGEYVSPAFVPRMITGGILNLPGKKGEGFLVVQKKSTVLVDNNQNRKATLQVTTNGKSKPFDLTLYYGGKKKIRHTFRIDVIRGTMVLVRLSGMQAAISKTKVIFLDEDSDGYFDIKGKDAIYPAKGRYGCPFNRVALIGGKLYEIRINRAGSQIEYRPYTGATGKVDIFKNWGGKTLPMSVVIKGANKGVKYSFDVAAKGEIEIPVGDYSLRMAYLKDIVIDGILVEKTFKVEAGKMASPKWGKDLLVNVTHTWDSRRRHLEIYQKYLIIGPMNETYKGKYLDDDKCRMMIALYDEKGKAVGRPLSWSKTEAINEALITIYEWQPFEATIPDAVVTVCLSFEVPGIGNATREFELTK